MWHTEKNPLKKVTATSENVAVVHGGKQRKLHKAFLRYHDPANWPLLREALKAMGRSDLIGPGKRHLIPAWQPAGAMASSPPRKQESAPARRRSQAAAPARPTKNPPSLRHPEVPRHPLSRRKGG
jgi:hypothetical protein